MIVNGLTGLAMWFIGVLFSTFDAVSLPTDLIGVLLDTMKFGAWVIGADLVAIFFANVLFWLTFKFTAGLVLFIWRLIPLT